MQIVESMAFLSDSDAQVTHSIFIKYQLAAIQVQNWWERITSGFAPNENTSLIKRWDHPILQFG